jgi:hypothetical protein
MKKLLMVCAGFMLLLVSPAAAAEMRTVELGLFGGYYFGDSNAGVNGDFIYGLRAGYIFTPVHEIELVYDIVDTTFNSVSLGRLDEEFTTFSVDWVFNFPRPSGKLVPYGRLGLAWVEDVVTLEDGTPSRDTDNFINFGGGLRVFTGDNFSFRFEGRFKPFRTFDVRQYNFELTAGLSWTLGRRR